MPFTRRLFLASAGLFCAGSSLLNNSAHADSVPSTLVEERSLGAKNAKVIVEEWYSLTCIHCAHFASEVFPTIKTKLIDTGKVRYIFKEFPLDKIALMGSMVARSLPAQQYEPFVKALLASQDRWVFRQGVNSEEELKRMAILAGMSAESFDKAIHNEALQQAMLQEQDKAEKDYKIDSTPTFRFYTPFSAKYTTKKGEISYDDFAQEVEAAAKGY